MLNNKGQSLILFVIVLPILLLVLILVVDIGKVIVLKQELDNISEIVLDYGLDKLNNNDLNNLNLESELTDLVILNKDDIDMINIRLEDDKIYIELNENVEGMLSGLIDISIFDVESSYVGYIDNNEKRIEKVRGWLIWILL